MQQTIKFVLFCMSSFDNLTSIFLCILLLLFSFS
jgi:hypothetical protein